ncbi:MAG: RNA-binding protein [Planctomycetes bacterium]|nr:RNA-binding protein [Planctomycetota bacterium]
MTKRLFVGNLSYDTTEQSLGEAFSQQGHNATRITILLDRETGRSRGFGFVEFASDDAARAALTAMDGASVDGRRLRVSEAEDRRDRRDPRGPGGPRERRDDDRRSGPGAERRGPPPERGSGGTDRDAAERGSAERGSAGGGFRRREDGPERGSGGGGGGSGGAGGVRSDRERRGKHGRERDRDRWDEGPRRGEPRRRGRTHDDDDDFSGTYDADDDI